MHDKASLPQTHESQSFAETLGPDLHVHVFVMRFKSTLLALELHTMANFEPNTFQPNWSGGGEHS
tara:strand:- start:22 stop:216 length:195 start_codon:yes stop_codon:yes gene_type:complete